MATKISNTLREEAREELRQLLAGDRPQVLTLLRHVSRSGMSRDISLFIMDSDGDLRNITYTAAAALGESCKDRHGHNVIRVHGCGMDMGFHIVYNLSSVLFAGQDRAGYVISHRWI